MNKFKRRKLKKKLKENKSKIIIISIIFFIVVMGVGYAASVTRLTIIGHAKIEEETTCESNITGNFSISGTWGQEEGASIKIDNYNEEVLEDFTIEMKFPSGTTIGPFEQCLNNTINNYLVQDANGVITVTFYSGEAGNCQWLSQINAATSSNGQVTPSSWAGGNGFNFHIHNDLITVDEPIYPDWVKFDGCVIYGDGENQNIPLTALGLSPASATIGIGEILNLITTKTPSYKQVELTYTSSNPSVATVDSNGVVTGVSVGTAVITVESEGKSASSTITVEETIVRPESITITPSSYKMSKEEVVPLQVTVSPENASVGAITWTSSDPTVATVDSNGNVTAIKKGNTTITATAGNLSSTCYIRVIEPMSSSDVDISFELINGGYTSGNSYMFKMTIENLTDEKINYFKIGLDLPEDVSWTLWQNNINVDNNYLELIANEWTYISANGTFTIQGSITFPNTYLEDGDDGYGNPARVIPDEYLDPEIISIELE